MSFPRRAGRWAGVVALVAAVALTAWGAHRWAWQRGLDELAQAADQRLEMHAAAVEAQLNRFDYLPTLLENIPAVMDLLAAPATPAQRDTVNHVLRALNATAGAELLYVLDRDGLTLAAADWDQPGTPLGMNLGFRPYVRDALAQGRGRFYGVGVTSGRPGYYLSYALRRGGTVLGLATAKVSLEASERDWARLPGQLMLVDERDVVILASDPRWHYRPLHPLAEATRAEIARSRPYASAPLEPLPLRVEAQTLAGRPVQQLDGQRWLVSERPLREGRWHLRSMDALAPVASRAAQAAATGALGMLALGLVASLWALRRRSLRHRLRAAEALRAAHGELESRVVQRTAELRETNQRLQDEVQARTQTEAALRAAQQELLHQGKMAALGQMSAGMMHELNQPLAAMRTLSDNAVVLLGHGRLPEVERNLNRLGTLVDRLGKLTAQLKLFAWRPGRSPLGTVRLAQAVAQAQFVVAARQREHGVEMVLAIEPPHLAVRADEGRLEQVLINLLGNGIDAMPQGGRLELQAGIEGEHARITVRDHGPGIPADILPRLFEPFTTSKPAGVGLGLGLMISAHFAREFGGTLHGENVAEGGARFVLVLPLASSGGQGAAALPGPAATTPADPADSAPLPTPPTPSVHTAPR